MSDFYLFGLSAESIEKLISVFKSHPNVTKVLIYGSRAMGNHKPASDIDLTLVGEHLDLRELSKIENKLDDLLLPQKIDLSLFRQIENADLIEHIERVGQVLYQIL